MGGFKVLLIKINEPALRPRKAATATKGVKKLLLKPAHCGCFGFINPKQLPSIEFSQVLFALDWYRLVLEAGPRRLPG